MNQSKKQAGFTIIEVLIVLAVGGLILMIVFQAIPTLQRNARNNQRKQDISAILEAVSHYELNNSAAMPANCGGGGGQPECNDSATDQVLAKTNLSFYTGAAGGDTSVSMQFYPDSTSAPASISNPNAINKLEVHNYQHCLTDGSGGSTRDAAGYRDVVALYSTEGGGGAPTKLCQEL